MSRWTIAFVSFSVIAFSFAAIAADDSLPRNIELKPGGAPADDAAGQTAEDAGSGTTTRRIVTEPANAAPRRRPWRSFARSGTAWQNPGNVVLEVQTELKRVGCDPGVADVVWGGHFAKVNPRANPRDSRCHQSQNGRRMRRRSRGRRTAASGASDRTCAAA